MEDIVLLQSALTMPHFENIKLIPLTQGRFAIVDECDYDWLMQWKWHYKSSGYAGRNAPSFRLNGRRIRKKISMHRLIANTPDGLETDHINGDRLDNRRCNLRICTDAENAKNRASSKTSFSKYLGVYYRRNKVGLNNRWTAGLRLNGKTIYLGVFNKEIDAAKAYNEAAIKYHGEFARLNEIAV